MFARAAGGSALVINGGYLAYRPGQVILLGYGYTVTSGSIVVVGTMVRALLYGAGGGQGGYSEGGGGWGGGGGASHLAGLPIALHPSHAYSWQTGLGGASSGVGGTDTYLADNTLATYLLYLYGGGPFGTINGGVAAWGIGGINGGGGSAQTLSTYVAGAAGSIVGGTGGGGSGGGSGDAGTPLYGGSGGDGGGNPNSGGVNANNLLHANGGFPWNGVNVAQAGLSSGGAAGGQPGYKSGGGGAGIGVVIAGVAWGGGGGGAGGGAGAGTPGGGAGAGCLYLVMI